MGAVPRFITDLHKAAFSSDEERIRMGFQQIDATHWVKDTGISAGTVIRNIAPFIPGVGGVVSTADRTIQSARATAAQARGSIMPKELINPASNISPQAVALASAAPNPILAGFNPGAALLLVGAFVGFLFLSRAK